MLSDLLTVLDKDSARYSQILLTLGEVDRMLYLYDDRELEKASELLAKQLQKKGADTGLTFYATGHAHLDLGWLWPIRETKRKALRTFSTAVRLLERYPDYIFGASQPQPFRWVKESDPAVSYTHLRDGRQNSLSRERDRDHNARGGQEARFRQSRRNGYDG